MEITEEKSRALLGIIDAGLCGGLGKAAPGQMCIEAAVCYAFGEKHSDNPTCVAQPLIRIGIRLNDSYLWRSAESRAAGLRRFGIAQLGTKGTLDEVEFAKRVAKLAITKSTSFALRAAAKVQTPEHAKALMEAADRCEKEGTAAAAYAAAYAAADADGYAANAAAAAYAANAEKRLCDFAEDVVQILVEMKTPGSQYLWLTDEQK